MDAVKYLKEEARMFEMNDRIGSTGCNGVICDNCAFHTPSVCLNGSKNKDFKAKVEAIEKWSAEHPAKTYQQDFLEKYPNAPLNKEDNAPTICPYELGYFSYDDKLCGGIATNRDNICKDCWNRSME